MIKKVIENIEKVMVGKQDSIEKMVIVLLVGGHVLIEDVPGVGKTTIAQALAKSMNCSFCRIQFTPDLVPSDILGVSIYNQKEGKFEFVKGPIYHQIILADEINRTSPKTQSSLLEVMEEHQITMDGKTYRLEDPFMVIATQNPIEYEGTFPLPEAQLDRFLMRIALGYPSFKEEIEIIKRNGRESMLDDLDSVVTIEELLSAREAMHKIFLSEELEGYIVEIVNETRQHPSVLLGCSPRASIALYKTAKAYAYIKGKEFVTPDDIKYLASDVLSHRMILRPEAKYNGLTNELVVQEILKKVRIPVVKHYA
ncbi:MoxR-like ATPase [Anaerosolibacter carboniphilus]|uniref:MoxR-like ATPase n=1 Tax=Anaerosolibacter carboniphilus TaxID=1417629 RepID=A0A841KWN4_9FIRM|nr:MoxR family ATPase [Anaerosolibacter carboniphilus]MBB6214585.1 MoxR-like ATPase [Anaerosolibacter carboniphilus]